MNREILFRGKRINNGEWVEGYYMKHINRTLLPINDSVEEKDVEYIIFHDAFSDWNMPRGIEGTHIDPATIGQYTGMTDKNGKKIFEGDIVDTYNYSTLMEIRWNEKAAAFEFWRYDTWYGQVHTFNPIKVLGNVFDNPELLEGD